jgi:hypothetical protein
MEEKIQEMLKAINDRYDDFEIESVDLSLVRRLENVARKVAERSLLRKLYFRYSFLFFIRKGLFIVSELYLTIDKDTKSVEYEIGRIYEPIPDFAEKHDLYFKFDTVRTSKMNTSIPGEIASTEDVFLKILREERLYRSYIDFHKYLVVPLEAKVLHYSLL